MSIRIDPATGLKVFNTRAAMATDRIAGKGYAVVTDESLKTLPALPAGATFNAQEQARYRDFKEARRGAADYMAMEGEFAKYLDDVYSAEPVPRDALTDECEILVVGAGFAGLLLWHKLRAAGFEDVRFCEKGGDVGGTWYWNRYPGIACDVEAYSYLPLLEEMGYVPTMKFASGFEILEYCQKMAEKFGFYDRCLFHTTVEATRVGRGQRPLDGPHGSRRRDACALRRARQRHSDHAETRTYPGNGDLQGRCLPHLALELPGGSQGQDRRHHRHRCNRRAGDPGARQRPSVSCMSFSARLRPIDVRDQRATTEAESRYLGHRTRLGAGTTRAVLQRFPPADRPAGQRRLSRRQGR